MPSLNCKTRKLSFTAADQRLLDTAMTLCGSIVDYGDTPAMKKAAKDCGEALGFLYAFVNSARHPSIGWEPIKDTASV